LVKIKVKIALLTTPCTMGFISSPSLTTSPYLLVSLYCLFRAVLKRMVDPRTAWQPYQGRAGK
jgi:hypothetical protein